MKKLLLSALIASMSVPALAQVQVGIQRPLITEDPRVYDDFSFITTEDFNKSGDGLTVKFYQSPELEATLAVDDLAESGYATSNLRYRGEGYTVDYVWKIQCADYVTDKTIKGSEGYTFGFDLTVADGCSFTVSALELDLLLEQNPSWRIRIVDANNGELYNSTWVTETGGYNSAEWGAGWYGRFTTTEVSFDSGLNYQALEYYPCLDDPSVALIPANLTLAAGTYKVLCDVDYNNENVKGISFDHLFIEGTLDGQSGISSVTVDGNNADAPRYNLAGQKVSKDYKGVVIQNGKKFIAE